MRTNFWELYESHPNYAQATITIDAAWREAKSIAPDKPSRERARLAEQHVYSIMRQWSHVGATDTEPVCTLRDCVRKHFRCEGGYLWP